MKLLGSWLFELRWLALLIPLAASVGWLVGYPFLAVALVVALQSAVWLFQLLRLRRWLEDPTQMPPEAGGIWGDVYDHLYRAQRVNRERFAELQSSVDYLRESFAAMRDGVVMVDKGAAIEWSNHSAQRLLGLQYPRDRGQALLNLVRIPEFHRYFLGGQYQEPLQIQAQGDEPRTLQFEVTPFGNGNRLVFARDVTKVAQLEQMRRDFVGNVSHELRTPLTVIKGYLETILANAHKLDSRFQRPLEQMGQQAQRMETLLRDLLWLSRIESVRHTKKVERVNVAALLQELEDEMHTSHPDRTLNVELETEVGIPGDYRELHSAISNLVLNALKYSEPSTPVTIRWRQERGSAVLSVIDQGIGVAEAHIPRLTERFYRVDESRSSRTGGTGLGLAIVKHVAAAHQAELRIESRVGQGSTFSLVFPLAQVAEPVADARL